VIVRVDVCIQGTWKSDGSHKIADSDPVAQCLTINGVTRVTFTMGSGNLYRYTKVERSD